MASRLKTVPAVAQPVRYECAACESSHLTPDGEFPEGWSKSRGNAWCADCTQSGTARRASAKGRRAA